MNCIVNLLDLTLRINIKKRNEKYKRNTQYTVMKLFFPSFQHYQYLGLHVYRLFPIRIFMINYLELFLDVVIV
jgi:hypothetical protein